MKFTGFVFTKSFTGFLFVHLVLLCLQPVSIIWKEVHMHACVWLYVHVWSGEREHKGSTSSGCILWSTYVKKEKLFQRFHPLFFLMSNISTLWEGNKLSCYVLFLQPLHWISTSFTWLFKDQQKNLSVQCGLWRHIFHKGVAKVLRSAGCRLQMWFVVVGARCAFTDDVGSWLYFSFPTESSLLPWDRLLLAPWEGWLEQRPLQ